MSGKDGASRTAKSRQRKELCEEKGDHRLCTPRSKCPVVGTGRASEPAAPPAVDVTSDVAGEVTSNVTSSPELLVTKLSPPAGLGSRGLRLWEAESVHVRDEAHLILLEESCRTADTLERLNGMVHADQAEWLELVRNEAESSESVVEVRVVVNQLLVEQRQQQDVFRRQVSELRLSGRAGVPVGQQGGQSSPGAAGAGEPEPSAGEASAAPGSAGGGGIGDLIDAAGRFTAQG